MNRSEFIKLAEAYMKQMDYEIRLEAEMSKYGILMELETPLVKDIEIMLNDLVPECEDGIVMYLCNLAFDHSVVINDREFFSVDELWDFYKA